jgi:uncharacterized protein (TIGR02001 family)
MKKIQKMLIGCLAALTLISAGAAADTNVAKVNPLIEKAGIEVNGGATVGSDIIWRGISVTEKNPGVQANVEIARPTVIGTFYVGVDGKSTEANPLMTYTAGYRGGIKVFGDTKLVGNIAYNMYQFQNDGHGWNLDNIEFNTVYTKVGLENLIIDNLNLYGSSEFVDKKDKRWQFNTEPRYGTEAEYAINCKYLGLVKVQGEYFHQNKWGENFGGAISNRIFENTDLKFAYNRFNPHADTQSYINKKTENYVASINYSF